MSLRLTLIGVAFMAAANNAVAADRWYSSFSMGVEEALVRNASKGEFLIDCPSGQETPAASFSIESAGVSPQKDEKVPVDILVDGKKYSFPTEELRFEAHSKAEIDAMVELVGALRASKAKSFEIVLPKTGTKERFSLLKARQSLGNGDKGILSGCLAPTERKIPAKDVFVPFELTPAMVELIKSGVAKSLRGYDLAGFGAQLPATKTTGAIHACGTVAARSAKEKNARDMRFHAIIESDGSMVDFVEAGVTPSQAQTVERTCVAVGIK